MKAWAVGCFDGGYIHARAETRGRAKTFHPEFSRDVFVNLRSLRAKWLDGDGPERELETIMIPCEHGEPDCCEGEKIDRAATLQANR